MSKVLRSNLFNYNSWLTTPDSSPTRTSLPPTRAAGWTQNSATVTGEERHLWRCDGDRLRPWGVREAYQQGGTYGSAGQSFVFASHVAAPWYPLRNASTPGNSIYGTSFPTTEVFSVEYSVTIRMPDEWPEDGSGGGGTGRAGNWIQAGFALFAPNNGAEPYSPTWPRYDLYFVRNPSTGDQELWGEYVTALDAVEPDTRGLNITGISGRLLVFGAAGDPPLRIEGDSLKLKVVLYRVPSAPDTEIGMDIWVDNHKIPNAQGASHNGFNRTTMESYGWISSSEHIYASLGRFFGFVAFLNPSRVISTELQIPATQTPVADSKNAQGFDTFVVRDNLRNPAGTLHPEPSLTAAVTLTTVSVSGEGSSVGTLPVQPSGAEQFEPGRQQIEIVYDDGYAATSPRGASGRARWALVWGPMNRTDRDSLRTFADTVTGQESVFTWTHPRTGESHSARFVTPPAFTEAVGDGKLDIWHAEATVEEVL